MRLIFEKDDSEDFLELILTAKEVEKLKGHEGICKNIPHALIVFRDLNVFIRKQTDLEEVEGEENATS